MKGRLNKTDKGWVVQWSSPEEYKEPIHQLPLHPDDVAQIDEDSKIFDNIEARIAAYPEVEFFTIVDAKINMVTRWAKLIHNEEYPELEGTMNLCSEMSAKINLVKISEDQLEQERNPNYKYFDIEDSKQQTAVEWLKSEIKKIRNIIPKALFEKAKKMEEEQMENLRPQIISNCVIKEISDEEIEESSKQFDSFTSRLFFQLGAQWYREQLKKK